MGSGRVAVASEIVESSSLKMVEEIIKDRVRDDGKSVETKSVENVMDGSPEKEKRREEKKRGGQQLINGIKLVVSIGRKLSRQTRSVWCCRWRSRKRNRSRSHQISVNQGSRERRSETKAEGMRLLATNRFSTVRCRVEKEQIVNPGVNEDEWKWVESR